MDISRLLRFLGMLRILTNSFSWLLNINLIRLAECDHVFCNSCLRNWYHHNPHSDQESLSAFENSTDTLRAAEDEVEFNADNVTNATLNRSQDYVDDPPFACPLCRAEIRNPPAFADRARQVVGTINALLTIFETLTDRERRLSNSFYRIVDTDELVSTPKHEEKFNAC